MNRHSISKYYGTNKKMTYYHNDIKYGSPKKKENIRKVNYEKESTLSYLMKGSCNFYSMDKIVIDIDNWYMEESTLQYLINGNIFNEKIKKDFF